MAWKDDLGRRKIRYLCFRLRSEATGNEEAPPLPRGFKTHYEKHTFWDKYPTGFLGWDEFGDKWDVGEDDPLIVVLRRFTIEQEWNATLLQVVPEISLKPIDRGVTEIVESRESEVGE